MRGILFCRRREDAVFLAVACCIVLVLALALAPAICLADLGTRPLLIEPLLLIKMLVNFINNQQC
jgi:hypothetical protein